MPRVPMHLSKSYNTFLFLYFYITVVFYPFTLASPQGKRVDLWLARALVQAAKDNQDHNSKCVRFNFKIRLFLPFPMRPLQNL